MTAFKFKYRSILQYQLVLISVFLVTINCACFNNKHNSINHGEVIDTLKVVTLYGPTSFFNYRGDIMGIDYENVRKFAEDEGMVLEIKTVKNINELISSLKSGEAQLAAFPVPSISEYNTEVIHCGHQEITKQVLVQKNGPNKINDVTELIDKDIYVEKNSKYQYRLENLNEELGGGINIQIIESDTIVSEDFLKMISDGKIDYAVVDSDIASLYKPAFPDLDISLSISSDQAASWAVALGLDSLASKINRWEKKTHSSELIKEIYKRYYDSSFSEEFDSKLSFFKNIDFKKGKSVSPYDILFKKYASSSGFDWELLAAIAYCESRFNPSVASRFGAYGLMQVMPSTAIAMGFEPADLVSPEINIKAATKILANLDKTLQSKIQDPEERLKFVVAAYNSGLGHIYDAMAIASKIGLDPTKWTGNVSITALMKSRPEIYNDPIVKHGYFRGRETVDFVDHVNTIYDYLKSNLRGSTET